MVAIDSSSIPSIHSSGCNEEAAIESSSFPLEISIHSTVCREGLSEKHVADLDETAKEEDDSSCSSSDSDDSDCSSDSDDSDDSEDLSLIHI